MPPVQTSASARDVRQTGALRRIAVIGNHPPRVCGIATFTRDVVGGLTNLGCDVHLTAMDPVPDRAYPGRVSQIVASSDRDAHALAGRTIEAWSPDAVLIEHEFGIFGGASGAWLLDMLGSITAPIVVTLHTVLDELTPEQALVMDVLSKRADRFIVMAHAGADILAGHGVPRDRIAVVPHGAPDRQYVDPTIARSRLGWVDVPTVLTFGLLSPGKGIEHAIDALPAILRRVPDARYVLVGATHPHLFEAEGERYREALIARANELSVAHAVVMVPRYVSDGELCDMLAAADVYLTPYGNPAQITSGTLAYALALGKPVVSTPYRHAREVLPASQLFPYANSSALAERVVTMLADPLRREILAMQTWAESRGTTWPAVARRTFDVLRSVTDTPALIAAE